MRARRAIKYEFGEGPRRRAPGPFEITWRIPPKRRLRGDFGTGSRLEHDDRGVLGTERRPAVVLVAELDPPRPEPITLVAFRSATTDVTHAVIQRGDGVGVRLQVQPPRGVGLGPAVHRQRDQVRAVLVVPNDCDSWLTRAAPNRRQTQQPELVAGSPQPDPSPAEPKECAVQQPDNTDDHSRRDTSRPRLGGGHAAPAAVATAIGDRTAGADPCGLSAAAAASTISGASLRNPLKVIHRPSDSSQ